MSNPQATHSFPMFLLKQFSKLTYFTCKILKYHSLDPAICHSFATVHHVKS